MTEQSAAEAILNKTIQVLVQQVGLTPAEVAQLRLSHLHLAGKNPNISFTPEGSSEAKTVELDLDTHRALVGWLVARPDSKSDYLLLGSDGEPLDPRQMHQPGAEVQQAEETEAEAQAPPAKREESLAEDEPAPPVDRTVVSEPRSTPPPVKPMPPPPASRPMPPISRPEPPPTRPERGPRPAEMDGTMVSPMRPAAPPPPSAPEVGESVNIPLPTAAPKPPAAKTPELTEVDQALSEAPSGEPSAVEQPAQADSPASRPQPATEIPPGSPATEAKQIRPPTAKPEEKQAAGADDSPAARPTGKMTAEQAAAQPKQARKRASVRRLAIPVTIGAVIVLCAACLGGVWLVGQSEPAHRLLAGLGLSASPAATESFAEPTEEPELVVTDTIFESPVDSPLPTPTLPPTATSTPAPTDTPGVPTDTPTPIPTDTPVALPTDTPFPTATPSPTDMPIPAEPAETPTPADTPTPAMKYSAPALIEPEDGFAFIEGNTIVLRWESVGQLAPDEQYAVRLVYQFESKQTFQGANIKDAEWIVPLSLFGQIDGPDNRYEWFVVVERLNDDGSGTAISPESERRSFTWK